MARPLRLQFEGAVYHVTSRGNERREIVRSDTERELFLDVLAGMLRDYKVFCHAWVLMDNHYHLLLETPEANLSRAIRHLNGVFTQKINRSSKRSGHLFGGRFKAVLVEKGPHLLELCRYLTLNPVRAGMVKGPGDWKWSSYRGTAGLRAPEKWLETGWVLGHFGKTQAKARKAYRRFVQEGARQKGSPWEMTRGKIYYGSDAYREKLESLFTKKDPEIPQKQRRLGRPGEEEVLKSVARAYGVEVKDLTLRSHRPNEARDTAIYLLRKRAGSALSAIAARFGVKYPAVGNRIWLLERRVAGDEKFRRKLENIK